MLRTLTVLALAALISVADGCGENEDTAGSGSDASSDVAVAEVSTDSPADAGPDATPADAADADAADASGDADAPTADADASAPEAGGKLGVMSLASFVAALPTKSFLLLNVHVPYAGEIPGTDKNLDYQDVASIEAFIGASKGVDVVLYCYSNSMALSAGNALVADGYTNVSYVDGGLSAWKNAGHPVEFHDY